MNMIDLKERIIVITGGARGIGYAIAERVIQSGGKVAIWDLNENMAKDSASALGSGTVAFGVNVADPVSVKNAAAATEEIFGRIDGRGGSVCLNSFGRFAKWISASIMLPPSSVSAR
ncbi:SDR family NAD(P)-dependent oxidoreductase [Rhizobium leguminosarum bv. trifolii]|nr:SDR family NAD(P)-dependent oxidoreductase [Rhizobium leguminosarum]QIO56815.1 SDR family NAD(P)-dependent oxidoreductase [Rhizobium leguminosarum bv. trifolii]